MGDARHSGDGDRSFVTSLVRHLGAAVALVTVVAAAFWGIGEVGSDDPAVSVAAPRPSATDGPTGAGTEPTATDTPTGPATTPTAPPTTEAPAPGGSEAPATAPPTGSSTEPATEADGVDPAGVSIQVLDAKLDDERAAATALADRLRADGYDVVVVNPAARVYDTTTVFYTAGHEAAARQVAEAHGIARVEPKLDNLSDSVALHVVVGRDRS